MANIPIRIYSAISPTDRIQKSEANFADMWTHCLSLFPAFWMVAEVAARHHVVVPIRIVKFVYVIVARINLEA